VLGTGAQIEVTKNLISNWAGSKSGGVRKNEKGHRNFRMEFYVLYFSGTMWGGGGSNHRWPKGGAPSLREQALRPVNKHNSKHQKQKREVKLFKKKKEKGRSTGEGK